MRKPKHQSRAKASQNRAAKRNLRRRKTEANKHARNLQRKELIKTEQKKFNDYMNDLIGKQSKED